MSFTRFWNDKMYFQAMKTRSQNSRKSDIFPKGLTHGFGPNMAIFPTVFLGNIGQENVFQDILEGYAFLGVLSFQNIVKDTFLTFITEKNVEKMAVFGPNPWANPFGKMQIFRLFELLVLIAQKSVCWFQNNIKDTFLTSIY